jgi:hypothetical protein
VGGADLAAWRWLAEQLTLAVATGRTASKAEGYEAHPVAISRAAPISIIRASPTRPQSFNQDGSPGGTSSAGKPALVQQIEVSTDILG